MLRKILVFLVFLLLFLLPIHQTRAAENFTTSYNVIYAISESGMTHVDVRVGLTNTTTQYYASAYSIQVGFENLQNVTASDMGEAITPTVKKIVEGNVIEVTLPKEVVGLNKTHSFTISFDTPDIAEKQGSIWEINIPGTINQETFTDFNIAVRVPPSFGEPIYSKPEVVGKEALFTKEMLGKSGISLAYGDAQIYDFALTYHLENKNLFPVKTEISVPPTTNYQDVFVNSMTPKPENVTLDTDGNWLAEYFLKPSEKYDVLVTGQALLYLYPKQQPMSEEQLRVYLKEQPYWETSNPEVKKLAQSLKTPQAIYDYVVKTLTYDFNRVSDRTQSRLGAVQILKNPSSAVCLEFTDLFVTLARAAGIPAREVDGFAYTQNARQRPLSFRKEILHAWPEYYDRAKQTWIMVDPTWGNTTNGVDYFSILDFDHFAFAKKGVDSRYPVPAGAYKLAGDEEKRDVRVTFAKKAPQELKSITVLPEIASEYSSFFPVKGSVTVQNVGNALVPPTVVTISASSLRPVSQAIDVSAIPPFGHSSASFSFEKTPLLTNVTSDLTIRIQDDTIQHQIAISPLYIFHHLLSYRYSYVIFAFILFIIALTAGSLLIFRRK